MENLNVGDKVRWTSQAGGSTRTKEGTILAVILPHESPRSTLLSKFGTHRDQTGCGAPRKVTSYLVEVSPEKGRAKPMLYWPFTSQLNKVAIADAPGAL